MLVPKRDALCGSAKARVRLVFPYRLLALPIYWTFASDASRQNNLRL